MYVVLVAVSGALAWYLWGFATVRQVDDRALGWALRRVARLRRVRSQ